MRLSSLSNVLLMSPCEMFIYKSLLCERDENINHWGRESFYFKLECDHSGQYYLANGINNTANYVPKKANESNDFFSRRRLRSRGN